MLVAQLCFAFLHAARGAVHMALPVGDHAAELAAARLAAVAGRVETVDTLGASLVSVGDAVSWVGALLETVGEKVVSVGDSLVCVGEKVVRVGA